MEKKTKIVATIGPASANEKNLKAIISSGLNVARMNFSHGDFQEHQFKVNLVRKVAKKQKKHISILQDLGGPKIRTGELKTDFITLKSGKKIILTTKKVLGDENKISVNYKNLPMDVKKGDRILLNDGNQELIVEKITGAEIHCKIKHGGKIKARRGVNLPDSKLSLSSFTPKDKRDLEFGIKNNIEFIALSFVQSARDIKALRKALLASKSSAKIIAKIETGSAIKNLDEILAEADGIMVARGDLAIEVGAERVPMLQKDMVKRANKLGKIVVVATQMLESMIENPVPTRAEVSDVANAILDGADAVMLSGETAMGKYPIEVVKTMARVIKNTEEKMDYTKRLNKPYATGVCLKINDVTSRNVAKMANELCAKAIVAFTETGTTALAIARYRVSQPIYVISQKEMTLAQMDMVFGAEAIANITLHKGDSVVDVARKILLKQKKVKKGDIVVIASGTIFGSPGDTNNITAIKI